MVALHDGQHSLRDVGEFDQARWGALRLQGEQAHWGGWHLLDVEDTDKLILGQAGRCVEEVQDLEQRERKCKILVLNACNG